MITLKSLGKQRIKQAKDFANRLLEDVDRDGYAIDSIKITDHYAKKYTNLTEDLEECIILASKQGDNYSVTIKGYHEWTEFDLKKGLFLGIVEDFYTQAHTGWVEW